MKVNHSSKAKFGSVKGILLTRHMLAGGQAVQSAAFPLEGARLDEESHNRAAVGEQLLLGCHCDRGLPGHCPLLQCIFTCAHTISIFQSPEAPFPVCQFFAY